MYQSMTFANKAAILTDLNTWLTSADGGAWTDVACDLTGKSGFIYTSPGTGPSAFESLQFVMNYKTNDNFLELYSAELIDTGGGDGTVVNLQPNPSFETVGSGVPSSWDLFTPGYAITVADDAGDIFTIAGLHAADFPVGSEFEVAGSTGNDATWTVADVSESGGDTLITTVEDITDNTADGTIFPPAAVQIGVESVTDIKYIQDKGAKLNWDGGTNTQYSAYYATTAALAAVAHVLSFYIKPIRGAVTTLKGFAQDADGAPAVDPSGGNLIAITGADYETLEGGWLRVSLEFTPAAHAYYVGIAIPTDVTCYLDGFLLEAKAAAPASPYTNHTAANDVVGQVLRNGSEVYKLIFTEDASAITNELEAFVQSDENSFSIVLGNTLDGDEVHNAFFYGRLVTPTGDPADADNSNRADKTCYAIGCSCHDSDEGKMEVFRDADGRFWVKYLVQDSSVGSHDSWGGGHSAQFHKWGLESFDAHYKSLFLRDVYWGKRVNYISLWLPREGYRGHLPSLFTMNDVVVANSEFNVRVDPSSIIVESLCTSGGDENTLNDTVEDFSALGVRVGDAVWHDASQQYVRVTSVAAHALGTEDLAAPDATWATGDTYRIYRNIAFDIMRVGYEPGETTNTINATTEENRSYNCFTPFSNRKAASVRKRGVLLVE